MKMCIKEVNFLVLMVWYRYKWYKLIVFSIQCIFTPVIVLVTLIMSEVTVVKHTYILYKTIYVYLPIKLSCEYSPPQTDDE